MQSVSGAGMIGQWGRLSPPPTHTHVNDGGGGSMMEVVSHQDVLFPHDVVISSIQRAAEIFGRTDLLEC